MYRPLIICMFFLVISTSAYSESWKSMYKGVTVCKYDSDSMKRDGDKLEVWIKCETETERAFFTKAGRAIPIGYPYDAFTLYVFDCKNRSFEEIKYVSKVDGVIVQMGDLHRINKNPLPGTDHEWIEKWACKPLSKRAWDYILENFLTTK